MNEVQDTPTFSNDLLSFSLQRKPNCIVALDISASGLLVKKAEIAAVKKVSKEVSLPGFRKGKAPEDLIKKQYAKQIASHLNEELAHLCFLECQKLSFCSPLNKDTKIVLNMKTVSTAQAELSLEFETHPLISLVDFKEIKLKQPKRPQVDEEIVKETIRQTQFFFANWSPVTDRAAKENDFVLLNVDVIENDQKKRLFSQTRFEITDKSMSEWMKNMVVGLKTGESKEGVSYPDPHLSEEEKKDFQEKSVSLELLEIHTVELPVLDDTFAQKLGVTDVATLHTNVKKILDEQSEKHVREKLREQVGQALLEKCQFDLPISLVQEELNYRFTNLQKDPSFKNHWDTISEEERKTFQHSLLEQSKKAVQMFYICRKIMSDAKLSVSEKDLDKPADNILSHLLQAMDKQNDQNGQNLSKAESLSKVFLEKAEDLVISMAQIEEAS
ncbi:MAG: trigger factor [Rhabdochlamydiaceae bacterium]